MQVLVKDKAEQIWRSNTAKACLCELRAFAGKKILKREWEAKCQLFVAETRLPALKGQVLAALNGNRLLAQCMYPMSHPMQLKCSLLWLELSFGRMMAGVWEDFPGHKIGFVPQIQNGRIEALLPNFLAVSRNKRLQSFFVQANNFMAQDLVRAAFRSLNTNRRRMKRFRAKRTMRMTKQIFMAVKQILQSEALFRKFVKMLDR